MTQEQKELLLKDLCGRLPYGVKVFYEYVDNINKKTYGYSLTLNTWCIDEMKAKKAVVKPYLFPLSSMTEEQYYELKNLHYFDNCAHACTFGKIFRIHYIKTFSKPLLKWLLEHHIDINELIPLGLAIEMPEEMHNIKNK